MEKHISERICTDDAISEKGSHKRERNGLHGFRGRKEMVAGKEMEEGIEEMEEGTEEKEEDMVRMKVGSKIGFDHVPVIAKLRCEDPKRGRGKKEGVEESKLKIGSLGEDKITELRD